MLLLWIPAQSMARRPSSCRPKGRQSAQHCTGRPSSWSMSMALEEVRVESPRVRWRLSNQ